jgi:glycerophosphoryl diester phosphodiesterase
MNHSSFSLLPPKNGIIGHRGVASLAPENTLAGFIMAAQHALDWVEFDVQLTKDQQLIIFHDDTVDRTTNGSGLVHEKTLTEIESLDAGSWFHADFQGEAVPVFSKTLPLLLDLPLTLNIELKYAADPSADQIQQLTSEVILTLQNIWPKGRPWPLISSFHWDSLHRVRDQLPQAPLGFLTESCTNDAIHTVAQIPNAALHCDYQTITEPFIALAQQNNVPMLAYTVNDPIIAAQLLNAGLFGLFSDKPASMLKEAKS